MRVSCITITGELVPVELDLSTTLDDLKAILSVELGVQPRLIKVAFHGEDIVNDDATMEDIGIEEDDMLAVTVVGSRASDDSRRAALRNSLPRMFGEVPDQETLERAIAMQNVNQNMQRAFEELPEAFASVVMLYIDVKVKGVPVKAFVDSGAQTTIMSRSCAERCGLMNLVDTRFAGVAVGVGQARILGKVHFTEVQMGNFEYGCSFSVLDGEAKMDIILGLDLLKRHHMMIDLKNDCLHIEDQIIPFLSEGELPQHARLH